MSNRWGLKAVVIGGCLLSGCESTDLDSLNPFKDMSLPDLSLPSGDGDAYAASDLLPEMAFGRGDQPDVDNRLGGYAGPVDEAAKPVRLHFVAPNEFAMSVRVTGSRNDYSLQGLGKAVRVGADVLWDLSILTFEDRRRRLSALRPPLAAGRMTTTETGAVRGVVLDFPALRARGTALPARGDAEYETLADSLRYLAAPLPANTVAAGDNLGPPSAVRRLTARTSAKVERDDIRTRVAGPTRYADRAALLAVYDGGMLFVNGSDRMTLQIAGHAVYDLETGLVLRSILRLTWRGQVEGRATDEQVFIETAITPRGGAA